MLMVGTSLPAGVFFFSEQFQKVVSAIKDFGFPLDLFLLIMGLQMPEIIVRCLPAGIFVGTVLALYRMGADSEIIALQTSGISLYRIFRPFFVVGFMSMVVSFGLSELVVPYSLKLSKQLMIAGANRADLPSQGNGSTFVGYQRNPAGNIEQVVLVANKLGKDLNQIMLIDTGKGEGNNLTWAPQGLYQKHNLNLYNGHIYSPFSDGNQTSSHFQKMAIVSPSASLDAMLKEKPRPQAESFLKFKYQLDEMKRKGEKVDPKLVCLLYERFSQPLACLAITIAAFPMALIADRRRSKGSLGYGAVVLFMYFVLLDLLFAMGRHGLLDPIVATFAPGLALGTMGAVMLYLKVKNGS
jgi:Predicted permeases